MAEAVAAGPGTAAPPHLPGTGLIPPHLGKGYAPFHICAGTALAPATSAPILGSPLPHRHRRWAHPAASAPGPGTPPPLCSWAHPRHICRAWLAPATSAPGLGLRPPHLRRDWAHPCRICAGTRLGFWSCRRNLCRCTPHAARHAVHAARHRCMRRVALLHAPVPFVYTNASRAHAARRGRAPSDGAAEDARRAPVRVIAQQCAADRPAHRALTALKARKRLRRSWVLRSTRVRRDCKYYSRTLWVHTMGDRVFGSHHPSERLPTVRACAIGGRLVFGRPPPTRRREGGKDR
jgi:hypothetical protein